MSDERQIEGARGTHLSWSMGDSAVDETAHSSWIAPRDGASLTSTLSGRITAALRATRSLAFPPFDAPTSLRETDGARAQAPQSPETDLLYAVLHTLEELALPLASAVFTPADARCWGNVAQSDGAETFTLDGGLWRELRRCNPATVLFGRNDGLWRAFGVSRTTLPMRRITLIPVALEDGPVALLALGFGASTGRDEEWLLTAGAVATACAAGIESLRQRQRIHEATQARDAYISLAAHELRSPITSIKGYSQLLTRQARRTPLPEAMQRSVESIEQQSTRMAEMIGELLDASRIQRGALELLKGSTDLVSIAGRAVARRRPLHPDHTFTVESDEPSLFGEWDSARLEQVLRDLLENAARHSPAGGEIVSRIWRDGDLAQVSILDSGVGIEDDDRDRIFEHLYRAPSSVKRNLAGLGLGLYVSQHIVERHGGRLILSATRTDDPSGSEFSFTLPLTTEPRDR